MKLTRYNIFETNSSSTNCLTIGDKLESYYIPETVTLLDLYGGRDFEYSDVDSRFTILASMCELDEFLFLCYKLYEFGVKNIILPKPKEFSEPWGRSISIGNWEVNESERKDIKDTLENDEDLKAWLFNPESEITGEDNNFY